MKEVNDSFFCCRYRLLMFKYNQKFLFVKFLRTFFFGWFQMILFWRFQKMNVIVYSFDLLLKSICAYILYRIISFPLVWTSYFTISSFCRCEQTYPLHLRLFYSSSWLIGNGFRSHYFSSLGKRVYGICFDKSFWCSIATWRKEGELLYP